MKNEMGPLTEFLISLIQIPSVKSDPAPGAPFGKPTLDALELMLGKGENFGFKSKNLDGYCGYIEFGEGEKEIAALCHLDIVPPGDGWSSDPYVLHIQDGKLYGRGIVDDKGPAAACLFAMKQLKDSGYIPRNRIRLILGLDEESGCECMDHYKSCEKVPDTGFTPDAKFPVIYAEKGIMHVRLFGKTKRSDVFLKIKGGDKANMVPSVCVYEILDKNTGRIISSGEVTGKSAHASLPEYGRNAVSKAVAEVSGKLDADGKNHPFIDFFQKYFKDETNGESLGIAFSDEASGALTCNVGLLSLEDDAIEMVLDIRYPVSQNKGDIEDILSRAAKSCGLNIGVIEHMDPIYNDPESKLVQTLLQVYNEETGKNSNPISIGGGTYARRIPNIVAFGPVFDPKDDVAHQADEYIKLDQLELCLNIYRETFKKLDGSL